MTITHKISLDLMHPQTPERIQVKQGDTYSRVLELLLFCDGEAWPIPVDATPLVRWFACDPGTGTSTHGIYDTLPDGTHAWLASENQLILSLTPEMLALPGLVQADVALVTENRTLATFNFEFYVNPAPADGTEPEARSYYSLVTLEQINRAISALQEFQASAGARLDQLEMRMDNVDQRTADLEQDVADLREAVF